jgi:protein-S-isoprenylcysteine O-methyltransferase Ste14
MTLYGWLIFPLWLALVVYWVLATGAAKRRSAARWLWWREIAVRLGFFALALLVLQIAALRHAVPTAALYEFNRSPAMGLVGFVAAAAGIALAMASRASLGRCCSCSPRAEHRDTTELITSGPYAVVRHPLYGGLLLAMAGSAVGQSVFWLLPLLVYGPPFILTARREERALLQQFPDRYRAYMKRTKMLLPFVL